MKKNLSYAVLVKPIISEKTLKKVDELNEYTFEVSRYTNKRNVKKAVEEQFKVKVLKVRMLNVRGKKVLFGKKRTIGHQSNIKKALVSVKSGDSINVFKLK